MKAVDYRDTLITYLKSDSIDNAAKNLNVSVAVLKSRIATMRQKGVKVPKLQPKNILDDLMVAQLNSIINKHNKEV